MRLAQPHMILGLVALLAGVPAARAQLLPHIGYVYPAGGRQGASFEITIGGQYLNGATNVHVSGAGIQTRILEFTRPLSPLEAVEINSKIQEMQRRKTAAFRGKQSGGGIAKSNPTWTPADEKTLNDLRVKGKTFVPPSQLVPALSEGVRLQVQVAPDAEPGEREIRIETGFGLSNPMRFCVGQLPEYAQALGRVVFERPDKDPDMRPYPSRTEMNITLPATVNGQIMPGGVHLYRFHARKGQPLVIIANARALLPFLPDAVPGWFQATLTLYNAQGKELAYDDDFRFHPDPVLYYQIPEDGEYTAEIRDSVYRGRQDFVYRVSLGELPFITSIFPLGGTVGAETAVELKGWNLPATKLTATGKAPGILPLRTRKEDLVSNHVPFAVDELPECLEREPNDLPGSAQRVALPIIVNGRIDHPGDTDVFSFEGRAGDQIVAEVYARRLESPLDSMLRLTDAQGTPIAFNDDHEDKGSGLNTHHADSYLTATLPAAGTYCLQLTDAQRKGGPEYAYRLRLSAPRPDYALRVVPSSVNVRAGSSVPLTVYALRKDGFSQPIFLRLKDAPPGFTLSGAWVPANADRVRLTLNAPATATQEPLKLTLVGRTLGREEAHVHQAVPAEDLMQAFAYRHLVPASELDVVVTGGRFMSKTPVKINSPLPVKIPLGGTARVQVSLATTNSFGTINLELTEPPEGLSLETVATSRDSMELVLQSDATKVKPGLKGNLIVNRFFTAKPADAASKAEKKVDKRFTSLGWLPAIPFEVVGK